MAKTSASPEPVETPASEQVSTLPAGVRMHIVPRAPSKNGPPVGWKGAHRSCGNCGAFIVGLHCAECSPSRVPSNVHMSPKIVA